MVHLRFMCDQEGKPRQCVQKVVCGVCKARCKMGIGRQAADVKDAAAVPLPPCMHVSQSRMRAVLAEAGHQARERHAAIRPPWHRQVHQYLHGHRTSVRQQNDCCQGK